jgi:NhaC family Na+:H+ antiporter
MSGTLGVPTMLYLPFCFFNIAAPIISVLLGFTGFKIDRIKATETQAGIARTL